MQESYSIPIQKIDLEYLKDFDINISMARVDKIHDLASGNKIYKLKPILEYAKAHCYKEVLSFGGAFSNHIHALALLAKQDEIKSIGMIRGEVEYAKNPTLSDAQKSGMTLEFVSRSEYKLRTDQNYLNELQKRYPDALIIPEGGSSQLAIQGCAQMAKDITEAKLASQDSNILAVASGTGATAAGLVCGLTANQHLHVYAVLKDESLQSRIGDFIQAEKPNREHQQYTMHNADYGGYAKLDKALLDFILNWLDQTGILLDPIYTSKMCLRVIQQIEAGQFDKDQTITLIHTGGLQGWRGMQNRVAALAGVKAWEKINSYLKSV